MPEASFYILIPCIKEEIEQPWISSQRTHMQLVLTYCLWVWRLLVNFLNHAHLWDGKTIDLQLFFIE